MDYLPTSPSQVANIPRSYERTTLRAGTWRTYWLPAGLLTGYLYMALLKIYRVLFPTLNVGRGVCSISSLTVVCTAARESLGGLGEMWVSAVNVLGHVWVRTIYWSVSFDILYDWSNGRQINLVSSVAERFDDPETVLDIQVQIPRRSYSS